MTNTYPTKATILIVEDIPSNIDLLKGLLHPYYALKVATRGPQAIKITSTPPQPDLILLDIMMPEMDGYEICRRIKEDPLNQNIPIIFLTAVKGDIQESFGLDLGAVDYITKPINPHVLMARVRTHLTLSDQKRHLEILVQERTEKLLEINRKLMENRLLLIRQLGRASEYRDNETGTHILRVGHYSQILALQAGFSENYGQLILHASMMHDIGKIGIPDHVLLKKGKLTTEEFAIIKQHPIIGAEIIGEHEADLLRLAHNVALSHHEQFDGGGYPHGIKGEEIPIAGRITALADVFDALTSERPYKKAWQVADALKWIASEANRHFDPFLAERFCLLQPKLVEIMKQYPDDGVVHGYRAGIGE